MSTDAAYEPLPPERLAIRLQELPRYLPFSLAYCKRAVKNGDIAIFRYGGTVLVRIEELDAFLRRCEEQSLHPAGTDEPEPERPLSAAQQRKAKQRRASRAHAKAAGT